MWDKSIMWVWFPPVSLISTFSLLHRWWVMTWLNSLPWIRGSACLPQVWHMSSQHFFYKSLQSLRVWYTQFQLFEIKLPQFIHSCYFVYFLHHLISLLLCQFGSSSNWTIWFLQSDSPSPSRFFRKLKSSLWTPDGSTEMEDGFAWWTNVRGGRKVISPKVCYAATEWTTTKSPWICVLFLTKSGQSFHIHGQFMFVYSMGTQWTFGSIIFPKPFRSYITQNHLPFLYSHGVSLDFAHRERRLP